MNKYIRIINFNKNFYIYLYMNNPFFIIQPFSPYSKKTKTRDELIREQMEAEELYARIIAEEQKRILDTIPIQNLSSAGSVNRGFTKTAQWLLGLFNVGNDFGVFREDNNFDTYWPYVSVGNGKYACYQLTRLSSSANAPHELNTLQIRTIANVIDDADSTFTYSGSAWATTANGNSWGGSYHRSNTFGNTATWTSSINATLVGIRTFIATNGGIGKVSIDGDSTKANLLPTAQMLVTSGSLTASALISNGGFLNPTDRVFNCYTSSGGGDNDIIFSDTLSNTPHICQIFVTGLATSGSSDQRVYLTARYEGNSSLTSSNFITSSLSGSRLILVRQSDVINDNLTSAFEYAGQFKPSGSTNYIWVGNWHGNDNEMSFSIAVDTNTSSFTNYQSYRSTGSLQISRISSLYHPEINTGSLSIGTTNLLYSISPNQGLKVNYNITHLRAGSVNTFYLGMLPTNLNKGSTVGYPTDVILNKNDGSHNVESKSDSAYMWDFSGSSAAMITYPTIDNITYKWAYDVNDFCWIEDRLSSNIKKHYLNLTDGILAYNTNDVWNSNYEIRLGYFPNGADPSLAVPR